MNKLLKSLGSGILLLASTGILADEPSTQHTLQVNISGAPNNFSYTPSSGGNLSPSNSTTSGGTITSSGDSMKGCFYYNGSSPACCFNIKSFNADSWKQSDGERVTINTQGDIKCSFDDLNNPTKFNIVLI